jgi:hypothetical protein
VDKFIRLFPVAVARVGNRTVPLELRVSPRDDWALAVRAPVTSDSAAPEHAPAIASCAALKHRTSGRLDAFALRSSRRPGL